jgi:hypothetical protein
MTIGGLWEIGEGALRRPPRSVHLALSVVWSRA